MPSSPSPVTALFLYRSVENDDEGDPIDHGVLRAMSESDIPTILRDRVTTLLGEDFETVEFFIYPLLDSGQSGVLGSSGTRMRIAVTSTPMDGGVSFGPIRRAGRG